MKKEKHGNSMFLNKDGYAKAVEIKVPSQNLEIDPRGKSSFRGKGVYIATGDVADVKGTKRMLADKKKTAKWY
tara:strand:- start:244 stop:462 length:219 start_codon:yes stop_codon:yes gene_type:complete